jgi:DHA2 family multidrug resistance protein
MLDFLDTTIVHAAIPRLQNNMGAILEDVAWAITGYANV